MDRVCTFGLNRARLKYLKENEYYLNPGVVYESRTVSHPLLSLPSLSQMMLKYKDKKWYQL